MILILIAIILTAAFGVFLVIHFENSYNIGGFFGTILGVILLIVACTAMTIYLTKIYDWYAAEHKAKIINSEYHTSYTAEEIFWANDVIEVIQEIKRNRYEIKGNLNKTDQ